MNLFDVATIIHGLVFALLQTVLLYFILATGTNFLNRPGVGRILLYHFLICIPLGMAGTPFIRLVWKREQGTPLTASITTWLVMNLIVLFISCSCVILQDSLLCVASLALCFYMYYSNEYATNGSKTLFFPWTTLFYSFFALFMYLSNVGFLDDMYASFDSAFGGEWYGQDPHTFLSTWRNTDPSPSPNSGISLGTGYFSNYIATNEPVNLWTDGGYTVVVFGSILTALIPVVYKLKNDDIGLINDRVQYSKLLNPLENGLENLMRFFSSIQIESLGNHSMGITNNAAVNEFIHGPGGSSFVSNISNLKSRESKNLQLLGVPQQSGRTLYQPGPNLAFI